MSNKRVFFPYFVYVGIVIVFLTFVGILYLVSLSNNRGDICLKWVSQKSIFLDHYSCMEWDIK